MGASTAGLAIVVVSVLLMYLQVNVELRDGVVMISTPSKDTTPSAQDKTVYIVASGDLRESANKVCWAAQNDMEKQISEALKAEGYTPQRAHPFDEETGHGFLSSQKQGMNTFKNIPKDSRVIVATAVWQYSHHVLAGLRAHRGPVLTLANFNGQWPGLVGQLNLNGGLTKMGRIYSTLWSRDFSDNFFRTKLSEWLTAGTITTHDKSHVRPFATNMVPLDSLRLGEKLAQELRDNMAIIGVFDEGCMGMYNAIIDDEMLNRLGIYKERLSQSALLAEMNRVSDDDARAVKSWLDNKGFTFELGKDHATELTEAQVLTQCKMYVAAVRIAADFSCDAIGIQYQQGLKDMSPASDLVEGLLNNPDRPPVTSRTGSNVLYQGKMLPHFNEVDEGAAVDGLVTQRVWEALNLDPSNTLHDVRWGDDYDGRFVWVFEISGAAPASHHVGGYKGSYSKRQPAMYFPNGGGGMSGVAKPGPIVWSRVYVEGGKLHCDIGRGEAVELPSEETKRRLDATTPQWPIMHAVLHGVSRDQMMARQKANHVQVAYATSSETANKALQVKATMLASLGITIHVCGDVKLA